MILAESVADLNTKRSTYICIIDFMKHNIPNFRGQILFIGRLNETFIHDSFL